MVADHLATMLVVASISLLGLWLGGTSGVATTSELTSRVTVAILAVFVVVVDHGRRIGRAAGRWAVLGLMWQGLGPEREACRVSALRGETTVCRGDFRLADVVVVGPVAFVVGGVVVTVVVQRLVVVDVIRGSKYR